MNHQLKITLDGVEPPIWRRVVVPSDLTLYALHQLIQEVMGWEDCHLHDFRLGRQRYELASSESFDRSALDEAKARLCEVAARPRTKLVYQYDFGDSWLHTILVEKITDEEPVKVPVCLDGARACPPEDSGGAWGYSDKLDALSGNDDEAEEIREWLGDFDPEFFDVKAVNKTLETTFRLAPAKKKRSGRRR